MIGKLVVVVALAGVGCKSSEPAKKKKEVPVDPVPTPVTADAAPVAPACAYAGFAAIADGLVNNDVIRVWTDGTRALAIDKAGSILEYRKPCWEVKLAAPAPKPEFAAYRDDVLWIAFNDGRTGRLEGTTWRFIDSPSTRVTATDGAGNEKVLHDDVTTSFEYPVSYFWSAQGEHWTSSTGDLWENTGTGWSAQGAPIGANHLDVIQRRGPGDLMLATSSDVYRREGTGAWTPQHVKRSGVAYSLWTDDRGTTYLAQGGQILGFDGKAWKPVLADREVDFDAVFTAGGAVWATGLRLTQNHTTPAGREMYRRDDKGAFAKDPSFVDPAPTDSHTWVHQPVVWNQVAILEETPGRVLVFDGAWRVVTK